MTIVLFLALASPRGAGADAPIAPLPGSVVPADTVEVATNALEGAALAFAEGLEAASADRLGGLLSAEGIRLQLGDDGHSGLSARQATATLRDFLRGYEVGRAVVLRAAPVQGTATRGFAELVWSTRAGGTTQELRRSLFVGLANESGGWLVDEVRILP